MILDLILLAGGVATGGAALCDWGWRQRAQRMAEHSGKGIARPVANEGANEAGAAIVRKLLDRPSFCFKPVVIFDEGPMKLDQRLHGIPIVGKPELLRETQWRL